MLLILNRVRIPVEKDGTKEYVKAAAEKLHVSEDTPQFVKILYKALDPIDKEQFYYEISMVVNVPDSFENRENFSVYTEKAMPVRQPVSLKERPVIVGFGPAGMFAALELIERGIKPLIFERGKKVEERSPDIQRFISERTLDTESNIQFGEGGAGTYSDGKLFSKKNNSEYVIKVLDTFIKFGADEKIRYTHKPHVGTDVLCVIVRNIRDYILEKGGEIYFGSKMTDLLVSEGKASGVVINGEKEYHSSHIYLAVGHSARDTFEMIHKKGVALEQKPISVGVRIEHPVEVINLLRYSEKYKDYADIGAAVYSFTHTNREKRRGVNTFCMCPGGEVVNASSENGMMAVNGMSYSGRSSAFSNAAMVVTCHTDDYPSTHPLAGFEFQKDIERKAFNAAGGRWKVPAQNVMDFLNGSISGSLNRNSFKMGAAAVNMHELFPPFVGEELVSAFHEWQKEYPLFISEYGILMGTETRTTCPARILRGANYESANIKNLFPIGEGSGYTGGITSSAADAIKAVEYSLA